MKSQKILMTLTDTPLGKSSIVEKLRAALGMSAGYKEHKINLVLTGDAVYLLRMQGGEDLLDKFIRTYELIDADLFIDEVSAKDRNVPLDEVPKPFKVINRDEIYKLLKESDLTASL